MIPYYQQDGITIYHGDCRDILDAIERPDLVLTDPPYIVSKFGRHGSGDAMAGTDDGYWLLPSFVQIFRAMQKDAFCVSFYSWRNADDMLYAWRAARFDPVSHIVWVKTQMGLGSYTRSKHESAYLLAKGSPKPVKVIPDVLDWRREREKVHPTQKPVNALTPIIEAFPSSLVLDPFMGSGSTLVAAQMMGRKAIGIEIEERYCEIAVKRLQQSVLPLVTGIERPMPGRGVLGGVFDLSVQPESLVRRMREERDDLRSQLDRANRQVALNGEAQAISLHRSCLKRIPENGGGEQ